MTNIKSCNEILEIINTIYDIDNYLENSFGGAPYSTTEQIMLDALYKAIEALKKQLPQKPTFYGGNYYCPNCNTLVGCHSLIMKWDNAFCKHCGQAIDWSDNK